MKKFITIQLYKCLLFGVLISTVIISYPVNTCSSDQDSSGIFVKEKSVDSENTNKWTPFLLTVTNKYQIPDDIFDVYGVRVSLGFGLELAKKMAITGLDCGFINVADTVHGIQLATIFNGVEDANGIQIGVLGNGVIENANGIQLTVFSNFVTNNINGLQIGGLTNNAMNVSGIQFAGLTNSTGPFYGNKFGAKSIDDTKEVSSGNMYGIQISGLTNICINKTGDAICGIQVSGLFNSAFDFNGVQIASLINRANNLNGLQVGLYNRVNSLQGVQIGLINGCNQLKGIMIGLINFEYTKKSVWPILKVSF